MLAEFWKVTRQAIHGFKKNKVPFEMLVEFCVSKNISLDWLLLGIGNPEPSISHVRGSENDLRVADNSGPWRL